MALQSHLSFRTPLRSAVVLFTILLILITLMPCTSKHKHKHKYKHKHKHKHKHKVNESDWELFVPDAAIIGVQKGGTTDFAQLLELHPEVAIPASEVHYFDSCLPLTDASHRKRRRDRGDCCLQDYGMAMQEKFRKTTAEVIEKAKVVVEKSPSYVYWSANIARKMEKVAPQLKVIVLLRDPVKRAYSHFEMGTKMFGRNYVKHVGGFLEAVQREIRRHDQGLRMENRSSPIPIQQQALVSRGLYKDQLKHFYRHLKPENILVLVSETLWETQDYTEVEEFLGLSQPIARPQDLGVANHHRGKDRYNSVEDLATATELLQQFFAEPNRQLCHFLKTKAGHKKCPPWTKYNKER